MKVYAMLAGIMLVAGAARAESVKWQTDYSKAVAKAKEDKKIVMVDVYTDWCGWCKKLDKDVYNDAKVSEKLSKDFIACKINPEKSAQNRQIADKFGTRGYPHIVFVNGDGKKISEIGGYIPADKFASKLDDVLSKAK
jgi:thioredoxin-related protein